LFAFNTAGALNWISSNQPRPYRNSPSPRKQIGDVQARSWMSRLSPPPSAHAKGAMVGALAQSPTDQRGVGASRTRA